MSDEDTEYVPAVETHLLASKHVKQTFKVQVMLPAMKHGERARFPVVYATDGNLAFDALKGISYGTQFGERDAPRFILVGIGYPGDSPFAGSLLRSRDFTFPGYPRFSTKPFPMDGVLMAEEGSKDFYGAEDFQQFIAQELIPFIDETYPTQQGARTYFGHSAGGGFGLFTLFNSPEMFNSYIISSAGLLYHGESSAGIRYDRYDFVMQEARKFLDSARRLSDTRVYMSVGSREEFEPFYRQWELTSSFYRFAAMLEAAAVPGLRLTTEVFPGETHMAVWSMSFIHGLRAVFDRGS